MLVYRGMWWHGKRKKIGVEIDVAGVAEINNTLIFHIKIYEGIVIS